MSKRKKKPTPPRGARTAPRGPVAALEEALAQAQQLLDAGQPGQAVSLLEPLAARHPRLPELHYALGLAQLQAGEPWPALAHYERAAQLGRNEVYALALASIYHDLGMHGYALHAFREVARTNPQGTLAEMVRKTISALERDMGLVAEQYGVPPRQVETAVRHLNTATRALQQADYSGAISANRQAIRILGDWPPPRNNLALALFFDGQPQQAIAETRQVLARDPDNLQALSNAVRFLAWSGRQQEAADAWRRLCDLTPRDPDERLKAAEAFAVMDDDQRVYKMLAGIDRAGAVRPDVKGLGAQASFFLAVAMANLGMKDARRHFAALQSEFPGSEPFVQAVRAGRRGLGWSERFPYFSIDHLISKERLEEFIELFGREERMPPQRFAREVARFVERFPQLVLVAEKIIWEDMQPGAGVGMLARIATPAAYAAIRRFALSQAGSDQDRMDALAALSKAGQLPPDETLRVWHGGKWQDVQMRQIEISERERPPYSPAVMALHAQGMEALETGDLARAEKRLRRAIELEPNAPDIYNNLATVYSRREEHDRAQELFRRAIELDPLYVIPRLNLNLYLLDAGDIEGAIEMLKPLSDATHFSPRDMALYSYAQARILIAQEEYERAKERLEHALEMWPEYEEASDWLRWLHIRKTYDTWDDWAKAQRRRDLAKRKKLQAALTTLEPTLAEALPLYIKEGLTGMADVVLPTGGWSALRKADLVNEIVSALTDLSWLAELSARWSDEERDALRALMARDGHMPWQAFDELYDNDLDESRDWQWHKPKSVMGRLRMRGLLVEATVEGELWLAVPVELRPLLRQVLA
ncbi:MAG: tetratricopeptide repeat protein [Anaerolineae bacterium]|nr:tetratricopeptide repeat protein [Anaerolineae bacterium]